MRPGRFKEALLRAVLTLVFAATPATAFAVRPDADCREWFATGAWSTPFYALATATLSRDVGGTFTTIEQSIDDEFRPSGGEFLFNASWSNPLTSGTYRVRLEVTLYAHATTQPMPSELAAWNPAYRFQVEHQGPSFTCDPINPLISSQPASSAIAGELFTYDVEASGATNFALFVAPTGATIDPATGLIQWTPAAHQLGPHVFVVRAKGASPACDFQGFVVNVTPPGNHPPEIVSEPVVTARIGEVYAYDVDAIDPDAGDTIAYALVDAPAGMSIDSTSGLITWPQPQLGAHNVTVQAEDTHGADDTQTFTVLVLANNRPPVFVSIPETTGIRLQPYLYDAEAIDPDAADVLLYSIELAPMGMTIDPLSGIVEWTPSENGTYGVTLRVEDSAGAYHEQTYAILVSDNVSNTPPIAGPDFYETNEDTPLVIVASAGVLRNDSDPDADALRAILLAPPEHGDIVLEADGAFRYSPATNFSGRDSFEYRAVELAGSGVSAPARVEIFVAPANEQPEIITTPRTWSCTQGHFEYDVGGIDPDDDMLTYSLLVAPNGSSIDAASGLITFSSTISGAYAFTVEATDPSGMSTTQTFVVEICPTTPVFVSVPPTALEPEVPWIYPLDVLYASSVEATFILRSPAPQGLILDAFPISDAHLAWTPSSSQVGVHQIELDFFYISPAGPRTLGQSFTVAVGGPGITSTPSLSGRVGVPYSYDVEVIDRGLGHHFFLSSSPAGASIDPMTGQIEWTPQTTHLAGGHHQFVVLVEDAAGIFATQAFSILVEPGPIAPQIFTTSLPGALASTPFRTEIVVRDDVESALSYELTTAPSGMGINPRTGLISWIPATGQVGTHDLNVRVTDRDGQTAEREYSITVRAPNAAPAIAPIASRVISQGQTLELTLSATDADNDPLSWTLLHAPAGATLESATGHFSFTPSSAQRGVHEFRVEARDAHGSADVALFTVEVTNINDAPILASIPHQFVRPDTELVVRLSARDPDGDAITFMIEAAPEGMTVSAEGLIRFRPSAEQVGQYELIVRASDPFGAFDEASLFLTVADTDRAPIIFSEPPAEINERTRFMYAIEAFDPDTAGPLAYAFTRAPTGAELDDDGLLTWDTTPTDIGEHPFTIRVSSAFGPATTQSFSLRVLNVSDAPEIRSTPTTIAFAGEHYEYRPLIVDLDLSDVLTVFVTTMPAGMVADLSAGLRFAWTPGQDDIGIHTVAFTVVDLEGLTASQSFALEVTDVNYPPAFDSTPVIEAFISEPYVYRVEVSDPNPSDAVFLSLVSAPTGATLDANRVFRYTPNAAGDAQVVLRATDGRGLFVDQSFILSVSPIPVPPDPSTVAPPLDSTALTPFIDGISFLYELPGHARIQRAVAENAIDAERAAVVRGRVLNRAGQPISGVRITIADHPEYGFTLSRTDGRFDLGVNGGGDMIVRYSIGGHVPADRRVDVPWRNFVTAPDVVLVPFDSVSTTIDLATGSGVQIARATPVNDSDGTRRPTLFFKPGTTATLELPDGTSASITTLTVRATELTVGSNGLAAMPAELPPASAYTHAVELSVDEAIAADARSVQFNAAVSYYLENFLNFPVGEIVPTGYYDRALGAWVPVDNGRVIRVLAAAELDVDGSGTPASAADLLALGIDDAERITLASTYAAGQSLWRVPLTHFSPIDCNWPSRCDGGDCVVPELADAEGDELTESPCERAGSIIDCENQVLGEDVALTGVSAALHYRSDRVLGRTSLYTLDIPVTEETVPANVRGVELEIEIAGRAFRYTFDNRPNQRHRFTWDGLDAYNRITLGPRKATVRVGYVFNGNYAQASGDTQSFGLPGGTGSIDLRGTRRQAVVWQSPKTFFLGGLDARLFGLGAWTLTPHHVFERETGTLFLGDGSRREVRTRTGVFAGNGLRGSTGDGGQATLAAINPVSLTTDQGGNLYIAEGIYHRVRKISRDGRITPIAGTGVAGFSGDRGLATLAQLNNPTSVAVDRFGNVFFTDSNNQRIRRIGRDGIIETVAGTGQRGFNGHVQHAHSVMFTDPLGVAIGPGGELFVTEAGEISGGLVRKILPNGPGGSLALVITIAGGGTIVNADDVHGGLARLQYPWGIAIAPSGDVYFTDTWARRVYRLSARENMLHAIAGGYPPSGADRDAIGDGRIGRNVNIGEPTQIAVSPDGEVFFSERTLAINNPTTGPVIVDRNRVRRVSRDGILTTAAGGDAMVSVSGGRRGAAVRFAGVHALAFDRNSSLYIGDETNRVLRLDNAPPPAGSLVEVPSEDGGALYRFTPEGRHVDTLSTLTGLTLVRFDYDSEGRLRSFTDAEGDETTIERHPSGRAHTIVGPDLHRTELEYDANDYLSVVRNPAGEEHRYEYSPAGLLTLFTDPRQHAFPKIYDDNGLLFRDEDPIGGSQQIERVPVPNGHRIEVTTALGRRTTYLIERLPDGTERRLMTAPSGAVSESIRYVDGSQEMRAANGTITRMTYAPDPRFGMDVPIAGTSTITTPNGRTMLVNHRREVELLDSADPLTLRRWTDSVTTNGRTSSRMFDAATRTWTTISAEGRTSISVLDEYEREIESRVGSLEPTYSFYDPRGRLMTRQQGNRTWTFAYGTDGFLASTTDPLLRSESYQRDPVGRILVQTDHDQRQTVFGYDANGNTTSITPPSRPAHLFTYDDLDRELGYTPPMVGNYLQPITRTFNHEGQPTLITDPDGRQVIFGYGAASGELESVSTMSSQLGYVYYGTSRQLHVIAESATFSGLTFEYDGGLTTRTITSGQTQETIDRTFDESFRLESVSLSARAPIVYQYDADSVLTAAGNMELVPRLEDGRLSSTTLGAVSDSYGYNAYGEAENYQARFGNTLLYDRNDQRDALGRVQFRTETIAGTTRNLEYRYDDSDRLSEVFVDGVLVEHYTYDPSNNRRTRFYAGTTVTADFDVQDRLTRHGNHSFAYNGLGQLSSRTDATTNQTTTYAYDERGNLTGVLGASYVSYTSDPLNRRIVRIAFPGTVTRWIWDGAQLIGELAHNGEVSQFVYATAAHVPDFIFRGSNTFRLIRDELGSVRLVVDTQTGQVMQRLDYDTFGRVLLDTNPGFQPFGFAGGLYDHATGLVRFGARDYDPELGRFTARDPSGFSDGVNGYVYVENDPVNAIDPSGKALNFVVGLLVGAVMDAGLDIAFQLLENGGRFSCIDWGRVGKEVAMGAAMNALGVGLAKAGGKLAKLRKAAAACRKMCFVAGTLVQTIDGPRPIEEIRAGDLVLAVSDETGEVAWKSVVETFELSDRPVVAVGVVRADGSTDELTVTEDHPFWAEKLGWMPVSELAPGVRVWSEGDGWFTVASVIERGNEGAVFNLEVVDFHSYLVGDDGIWVHNCGGGVTYARPSGFRKGVRDKVWDGAVEPATGRVRDPVTGRFMSRDKAWDMGHKPGHEFRKHQQSAGERGIERKQFLDEYNDPSSYRPELPSSNSSHRGEDVTDEYFGH